MVVVGPLIFSQQLNFQRIYNIIVICSEFFGLLNALRGEFQETNREAQYWQNEKHRVPFVN